MILTFEQKDVFAFDETDILRRLGMPPEHRFGEMIRVLLAQTREIAKPKGIYRPCKVEKIRPNGVTLAHIDFCSAALSHLFAEIDVVYPCLSTCGQELSEFSRSLTDLTEKYAFDAIMDFYQKKVDLELESQLLNQLPEGFVLAKTNPGELPGWDIREQKKMFALFGEEAAAIGVKLKERCFMTPLKTVSGIRYPVKEETFDCVYCRRKECSRRKAPFDQKEYLKTFYRR